LQPAVSQPPGVEAAMTQANDPTQAMRVLPTDLRDPLVALALTDIALKSLQRYDTRNIIIVVVVIIIVVTIIIITIMII
jgi:hypothetical protein